ncbi:MULTISPECIES: phosphoadenylyl-sulfate reductase [Aliivibrio]|uniref:Phosphoadenosine 5'-phosphosulfate reductase n=1 Tax=Aliivibrio sifiae TaxID=566293 RepID=A0A2S7X1E0_9GAMM|nr:phosphoadenylyl-sulfate reductase [Aliivibrio sifiae]PQJ83471.1 phosphoadenosine phosphosulfate reductase [Aliivibrio sifiae]
MPKLQLSELLSLNKVEQILRLAEINTELEKLTAQERVSWALDNLEGKPAVSSSFGIQAAVMLQLVTEIKSDTPVILTDTGYLFPETYQFIDELTKRLSLNLQVFSADESPMWQEARYGKLWEQGVEGLKQYNRLNKVQPMRRALDQLEVSIWFSGLRRDQSSSRSHLPILSIQNGVFKFLPVIDWSNKDVHYYLEEKELPYHPLREEGYLSVGDTHTTQKWAPGMKEEDTRFFGLKRECGLHEDDAEAEGSGI